MFEWISANLANILISAILIIVVVLIFFKLIRDKKQGRSSCGGNCAHCSMCAACKKKEKRP